MQKSERRGSLSTGVTVEELMMKVIGEIIEGMHALNRAVKIGSR